VLVEGLRKTYPGGTTAVDGLSFTAAAGEITLVLGPNGAGKTSTVEICEGLRTRDAGTVRVLGRDPAVGADRRSLAAEVGAMPQAASAYPGIHAAEMLRLVARMYAHPLDPGALLERLGMTGLARTPVRRLSGGEQQRLSLAIAVVGRPRLVFLDEPTAGLDVQARHDSWDLMRELRSAGVTIVLTTHLMDEAEALADHVVVVDHGTAVASGSVVELTRGGAEGQVRFRAPAGLDVGQLLSALPTGTTAAEKPKGQYVVEGLIDPQLLAAVTAWAAGQRALLEDLRVEQRSLEDVFLELTGRGLRP
jgi:ABC-2 type transport system ATP-binding protein